MRFPALAVSAWLLTAASPSLAFAPVQPALQRTPKTSCLRALAQEEEQQQVAAPTKIHGAVYGKQGICDEKQQEEMVFANNGLFQWMTPYLDLIGYQEGKTLYGGVSVDVDATAAAAVSSETSARLRRQAALDLTNIGGDERARRGTVGNALTGVAVVYIGWASLIADHGDVMGHVLRMSAWFPVFFAVGLKLSAQRGLWNVAQAGLWDVGDGQGLQPVDNAPLARALLQEVNNMNVQVGLQTFLPMLLFSILPQSSAASLVTCTFVGAILYFVGKE